MVLIYFSGILVLINASKRTNTQLVKDHLRYGAKPDSAKNKVGFPLLVAVTLVMYSCTSDENGGSRPSLLGKYPSLLYIHNRILAPPNLDLPVVMFV